MAIKTSELSKPQWRFERKHRVRLFVEQIHINDSFNLSKAELFWLVANKFKETSKYAWVEANHVTLEYEIDNQAADWFKQVRFFANLSEAEYVNYCLKFFDHHDEKWK